MINGYEKQENTEKPNNYSRRDFLAYAAGVAAGLLFAGGYSGKAQADSSYFSLAGNLATGANEAIKPGEIYRFKVQSKIPENTIFYGKTPEIAEFKIASLQGDKLAIASPNIAYVNFKDLIEASPAMNEFRNGRYNESDNQARYGNTLYFAGEQARVALQNYAKENRFGMVTTSRNYLEKMLASAEVQSPDAWKNIPAEKRNQYLAGITPALDITPYVEKELQKVVEREKKKSRRIDIW
ncbi:twin-arginine translocation signal domain-containing protein [Candidatus Pacearchaeota archaeon]|nr:twin-arginine translocation signal domain-containing protein [Candidatus Pacearchaeota archaeon]